MMMCSIGVSAARARRGWMAVVQTAPPATAIPAAALPFRNVRRVISVPRGDEGWRGMWTLLGVRPPQRFEGNDTLVDRARALTVCDNFVKRRGDDRARRPRCAPPTERGFPPS